MSEEDFFSQWGVIVAFFIGLAGLGTFLWNIVKGYNKRQDEKEKERLRGEEIKAAIIKKEIEDRALSIKVDAERTAGEVKKEVENRAVLIKQEIEMTSRILKEHTELMNTGLKAAIKEVDDKVMKMLSDLGERASLTNGNVGKIRSEILDLKRDLQDLWDRMDDTDAVLGTTEKMTDQRARKKRQQDFDRRRKQKEIDDSAESEGETNRGYRSTLATR